MAVEELTEYHGFLRGMYAANLVSAREKIFSQVFPPGHFDEVSPEVREKKAFQAYRDGVWQVVAQLQMHGDMDTKKFHVAILDKEVTVREWFQHLGWREDQPEYRLGVEDAIAIFDAKSSQPIILENQEYASCGTSLDGSLQFMYGETDYSWQWEGPDDPDVEPKKDGDDPDWDECAHCQKPIEGYWSWQCLDDGGTFFHDECMVKISPPDSVQEAISALTRP